MQHVELERLSREDRFNLVTPEQKLAIRLAQLCCGRENHAELLELEAVSVFVHGKRKRVHIAWHDAFTEQSGSLGWIRTHEAAAVVCRLFPQLRAWRERCCPEQAPAKAKGVAA